MIIFSGTFFLVEKDVPWQSSILGNTLPV